MNIPMPHRPASRIAPSGNVPGASDTRQEVGEWYCTY